MTPAGGDLVGRTISGYRLESVIGRGGMGVVYLAERKDGRVALKLLNPWARDEDAVRERLLREAQITREVRHPGVLPVLDWGEGDSGVYVTMPYVAGSDLRRVLLRDGALDPSRAVQIVAGVLDALEACHRRGLVHRDLKPANVLLEAAAERERVYVCDFGLAGDAMGGGTRSGQLVGSVDYMAPEQLRGEQADARSDIYAAGCLLYHCLAGAPPYQGSDAEVMWAKLHHPLPTLFESDGSAGGLDAVMQRATALDADDRYPSAAEFAAALRAADVPLTPPVAPTPRPDDHAASKRRRVVMLVAGLLAAAAVAFVLRNASDTPPPPPHVAGGTTHHSAAPPIAYDNNFGVYVRQPGKPPRRDPLVPRYTELLAYSPDGRYLAYDRLDRPRPGQGWNGLSGPIRYTPGPPAALWVVRSDGTDRRPLPQFQPVLEDSPAAWSPDDHELAVTDYSGRGNENVKASNSALAILPIRGRERVLVSCHRRGCPTYQWPAWSPDGRELAYVAYAKEPSFLGVPQGWDPGAVWMVPATGGAPHKLNLGLASPVTPARPGFTPDGRRIVFSACTHASCSIYETPLNGGHARRLLSRLGFGNYASPDLSANGKWLTYTCQSVTLHGVCVSRLDGSDLRQTRAGPTQLLYPTFTPAAAGVHGTSKE